MPNLSWELEVWYLKMFRTFWVTFAERQEPQNFKMSKEQLEILKWLEQKTGIYWNS